MIVEVIVNHPFPLLSTDYRYLHRHFAFFRHYGLFNGMCSRVTLGSRGVNMNAVLIAQIGMSVFFGAPAIFVLLSKRYQAREKQWAYGTLGMILGFWLRGR